MTRLTGFASTVPHLLSASACPGRLLFAAVLLLVSAHGASAQTTTNTTDKMTPSGIAAGAPAGSYQLSGMESINLFNGNLDFRLPLVSLGGRGSAQSPIILALNTKRWSVRAQHTVTSDRSEEHRSEHQ